MQQFFRTVLILSSVGGALTVLLLLIKPITSKRFSSSWQYYIWLVVLVAMILPVRFSKRPVEVNLTDGTAPPMATAAVSVISEPLPEMNISDGVPVPVAELESKRINLSVRDILPIIWICGSSIFFISALISYWVFLSKKRRCPITKDGYDELCEVKDKLNIKRNILLRKSDDLTAPMLVGLFKPVIYVPDRQIDSAKLIMIFMHELTHYKRRDLVYKWFSLAVNAIHWFNPLIYIAVRNINEECELSCDISVTKKMADEGQKQYMNTIIGLIGKGDTKNV